MWIVKRRDKNGGAYFRDHPKRKELFKKAHQIRFCKNLNGYHNKFSLAFAKNFDGQTTRIGNFTFTVSEESIATLTRLKQKGDRWFKSMRSYRKRWKHYLIKGHRYPNWSMGIPQGWIKLRWKEALYTVHKFFRCEG